MMVFICLSACILSESSRTLLENAFAELSVLVFEHSQWIAGGVVALVAILLLKRLLFLSPEQRVPSVSVPLQELESRDDAAEEDSDPDMPLKLETRPDMIQCYNPSTLRRIGEVKAMTRNEVKELVSRARVAQREWSQTTFAERRRVIATIAKYIAEHQDDIVRVACRDSGKTKVDAMFGEVLVVFAKVEYLLRHGEAALQREYRPTGLLSIYKSAWVEYHPMGVIGTIAPWNYPFQNWITHVLSCLFTGNAIVAKVSEHTAWSSQYYGRFVAEALRATGHNPDLVLTVTGFAEAGEALIDSVDKVIFTGSPQVGKLVMGRAAQSLTPVTLELGGKDPAVICEDAHLSTVVPVILRGVYQNCGQNCVGIERVFVYEKIYEEFLTEVTEVVKKLRQGDPLGKETVDMGAMVMPDQLQIIQELVDDAVQRGAKLLAGGKRNEALKGLFYLPTVLADVTPDMRIAKEEVFGPVMSIIKVKNDEELLRLANDSNYGLGSSVFSENRRRQERLGNGLRCGMTALNDFATYYMVQSLPFGGVKNSGFGRFAGHEGLRDVCLQKSVVQDIFPFIRTSIPGPLQYPVSSKGFQFLKGLVCTVFDSSLAGKVKGIRDILSSVVGSK